MQHKEIKYIHSLNTRASKKIRQATKIVKLQNSL